jgi:hypothetical protein
MNRIQFFILTGLSSLVVLLLIGHIFLVRQVGIDQAILNQAQQRVNQGQAFQSNLKQLAIRIFQDSQKTGDQGLKDLLARQQITYTPTPEGANSSEPSVPNTPAPAPTH